MEEVPTLDYYLEKLVFERDDFGKEFSCIPPIAFKAAAKISNNNNISSVVVAIAEYPEKTPSSKKCYS